MQGLRELCALPPASADSGSSSGEILPSNRNRELLVLYTTGAANVWIAFGVHDAEVGKGLVLKAKCGSRILLDRSFMVTSRISAITEGGAIQSVQIQGFE
jgi:hypothetical protein